MVSKAKKIVVAVAVPISHAVTGLAGGFAAVAIVQPTEEFRAGPIVLQQTVEVGSVSTFSGEPLFKAPPFRIDVDLKIMDKADTPKAIQEIKEIYTSDSGTPNAKDVEAAISSKYKQPFMNQLHRLIAQTALVFAGGAALAMRARNQVFNLIKRGCLHCTNSTIQTFNLLSRQISRNNPEPKQLKEFDIPNIEGIKLKYRGFFVGVGRDVALGLTMSGAMIGISGSQIDIDKVQPRAEDIASQPVREYLLSGTSKMVPNFKSINDELALHLSRSTRIGRAIENGSENLQVPPSDIIESKTYLIVSDPHNLPTAPQLIEAIARAGDVDGIIILGDFLNTGAQFEIDSLGGYTIGDTHFQGFGDIKTCVEYLSGECKTEGKPFEIYALLGNHDTKTLMTELSKYGIKSLSNEPPSIFENQLTLDDACRVDGIDCQGEGMANKLNKQAGVELKDSVDFSADNVNRPTIGFFASKIAALEFEGSLDTIILGGTHEFKNQEKNGRQTIEVGAVGAGFPRMHDSSNVVVVKFDRTPNGVKLSNCVSAQWDPFNANEDLTVESCNR